MGPGERRFVFAMIAAVTLMIACVFAYLGCWLVLPFAGMEIGVLAWAFDAVGRRSGDYESLSICGDEIRVERKQGEHLVQRTFNCHWVQLIKVERHRGQSVGLALRSHGRETELGLFLTDEGRLELAEELQTWLKPGQ